MKLKGGVCFFIEHCIHTPNSDPRRGDLLRGQSSDHLPSALVPWLGKRGFHCQLTPDKEIHSQSETHTDHGVGEGLSLDRGSWDSGSALALAGHPSCGGVGHVWWAFHRGTEMLWV